ncbi:HD-GYP domain-containing protein [Acinetobacter qingfengensis]|nr:HD domain-containing phosphohydrolase [Acinetobacter qingfengensis]
MSASTALQIYSYTCRKTIYINQAFEQWLGYSLKEIEKPDYFLEKLIPLELPQTSNHPLHYIFYHPPQINFIELSIRSKDQQDYSAYAFIFLLEQHLVIIWQKLPTFISLPIQQFQENAEKKQFNDEESFHIINNLIKFQKVNDPYTVTHEHRVGLLCQAIGEELGWDQQACQRLYYCGLAHDIGKIAIPPEILHTTVRLNHAEKNLIRGHAVMTNEILKDIPFSFPLADIASQHHERMDGSGYPKGLTAQQILPESKILIVADVVEAMTLPRSYRKGLGLDAALKEIHRGCGTSYDTEVCQAVFRLFEQHKFAFPQ